MAEEGDEPRFAQLYVHDPTLEDVARKNNVYLPRNTTPEERRIAEGILIELQNELKGCNPYIRNFIQICEIPDEELNTATIFINEKERPADAGSRTYTSDNLTEVSICMPEEYAERGIVVRKRGGGITEFSDKHRSADPLHFILLHPFGHDGWHPDLRQTPTNGGGQVKELHVTNSTNTI